MPEGIIKKREDQLSNSSNHKTNSNNNNHHQHKHKLLSRITVPILFAALVGTTAGTIALAAVVGGGGRISSLFPSAEAAKIYKCDGLNATIVRKEKKNNVLQGPSGDDVIVGLGGDDQIFGNDGDDDLDSRDGVVDNDQLDGCPPSSSEITNETRGDFCVSDPDSKVNCEII
jgi:Ca2+-binding RTX toxin-like protein